jgi:methenyltetrahydrofolate cyclohydrolase
MTTLGDLTIATYLGRVSSADPTPGGGSVASLTAALAAALGSMVAAISDKKSPDRDAGKLAERCTSMREALLELSTDDEAAFRNVIEALRLPKDDPSRADRLDIVLRAAADVPMTVGRTCLDLLAILESLSVSSSRHAVSDVGAAAYLALAALQASRLNVQINAIYLADQSAARQLEAAASQLETEGQQRCRLIVERVVDRIRG